MNLLLQAAVQLQKDADITLLTGFGEEASYIYELLRVYSARVSNAKRFAIRNRVLLLASEDDVPIDIALGHFRLRNMQLNVPVGFITHPNAA